VADDGPTHGLPFLTAAMQGGSEGRIVEKRGLQQ
jgi:hypothetical protein